MVTVEDLLYEGNPFLPPVRQEIINLILADVRQDSLRMPGELIAIRLCQVAEAQAAMILAEGDIVKLRKRFGTIHTDIGPYLLGFTRPPLLLRGAFTAACEGFSHARSLLHEADLSFETRSFFLENLEHTVGLLRQDSSGRLYINRFVTREAGLSRSIYRVGLKVAEELLSPTQRSLIASCGTWAIVLRCCRLRNLSRSGVRYLSARTAAIYINTPSSPQLLTEVFS